MSPLKHRAACIAGFLAIVAFCNIAFQVLGILPGLIVTESSTTCRYFRAGPVDWHMFWNYMRFVGTMLVSFALLVHVTERLRERKSAGR